MTIKEFENDYYMPDSILERFEYNKEIKELRLYCGFCNFMQEINDSDSNIVKKFKTVHKTKERRKILVIEI